jgi:hypothetical protein
VAGAFHVFFDQQFTFTMKRLIYGIVVLVALAFCVWLALRQPAHPPIQNVEPPKPPQPTNTVIEPIIPSTPPPQPPPSQPATNALVRPNDIDEDHWNQLMLVRQIALEQNQPVKFYARVLDQNDQPVEGAKLQITLSQINEKMFETTNFFHMNMGDEITHIPLELVSDRDGWIKVTGVTGDSLWIEALNKEGYSCTLPNIGSFLYEPNGQHRVGYTGMEDAFNPAKGYILHLRKIDR